MEEIWKDIKDYEGLYQISNLGRIKSLRYNKERLLTPIKNNKTNYIHINLCKHKVNKTHYIHRLLGCAFVDNKDNKPHINHKNGVRDDNRIENLEWVTPKENHIHKYYTLNYKQHRRRHTEEEVLKIREIYNNNKVSQIKLVEIFNSNRATINKILKNKAYICK